MELHQKLAETLLRDELLVPGDAVLVGVSGGPDSVALLHLLTEVAPALSLSLEVAHVEHGIRGARSREDAEFVRRMAAGLSLPFHVARLDLHGAEYREAASRDAPDARAEHLEARAGDRESTGNLEARARTERYRFFARVAAERCLAKVAVGHNRGDQVETMLMWLLRGCGPEGLAGMPAARPLDRAPAGSEGPWLIRPLLDVPRDEILGYLESRGLEHREDDTNRDTRYLRNWIRRTLLPQLREQTDGGLEHRVARLGGMLRSDNVLLERRVAEGYPRVSRDDVLDRAAFLGVEPELRPRMVRFWLRRVTGTLRRVGHAHVDAVLDLIAGSRPHARVSLTGAWTVARQYESVRLVFATDEEREGAKGDGEEYSYPLPLEGELLLPEAGLKLTAWRSDSLDLPANPFEAAFDLRAVERVEGTLLVRNFRPGDRFRPLGMAGHKKLKDLFMEMKLPRPRRRTLPLVLTGEEIVWIPGCARGDFARLEPASRAAWRVKIRPSSAGVAHDRSARRG
ncbi:MAG: tRNA lysidine(34) synthetase TilS [Deltaproteobacteria bacterium]|nr:tRNA lysidine(34) synthetase TilS [Deltaproteobacteria bacterium]